MGVNTDELVASYKSTPMIPFEDRIALMRAIKDGCDLIRNLSRIVSAA